MTSASTLLPQDKKIEGRASYYGALSYLVEIAFQNEDYQAANDLCRQIIDAGLFDLVSTPEMFFRQNGTVEEIWSVIHTQQQSGSLYLHTIRPTCNSFTLKANLTDRAYAKVINADQRTNLDDNNWSVEDLRFTTLTFDDQGLLKSAKYTDPLGADNLPAKRFAEILLTYAECQARLGNTDEAIASLNKIRARALVVSDAAGNVLPDDPVLFGASDFTSADELIEAIILERQVEFVMEGNRFHDLIRLRRPVNGLSYDDPRLRLPIPQRELDANPNLVQNPGY